MVHWTSDKVLGGGVVFSNQKIKETFITYSLSSNLEVWCSQFSTVQAAAELQFKLEILHDWGRRRREDKGKVLEKPKNVRVNGKNKHFDLKEEHVSTKLLKRQLCGQY